MTMTTLTDELLPCPFCGTAPFLHRGDGIVGISCGPESACNKTGLCVAFSPEKEASAIAAWNRRALLSASKPAAPTVDVRACRNGFEQQRKVGINVDWFTWQIAWHDAMFTQVEAAPIPSQHAEGGEIATKERTALERIVELHDIHASEGKPITLIEYDMAKVAAGALASPAAVVLDDERAAFEKWASQKGWPITAGALCYSNPTTEKMWEAWQARAASPQPVAQTERALTDGQVIKQADHHSCANGYGVEDRTGVAHDFWWTFDREGLLKFYRDMTPAPPAPGAKA